MSDSFGEVEWFQEKVDLDDALENNDQTVVLFTAPSWCNPCRQFAPHYDSASKSAAVQSNSLGRTSFVALDVDDAPWSAVEYGVRSVPTVKLFVGGKYVRDLKERVAPKLLAEINA